MKFQNKTHIGLNFISWYLHITKPKKRINKCKYSSIVLIFTDVKYYSNVAFVLQMEKQSYLY